MDIIETNLLIIGAGPGGYVCGIRAGQLGIDAIVVEANKPGGTCLNVGCIPSKALIHVADEFSRIKKSATSNSLGITCTDPSIDLRQAIKWKDGIVSRLNGGVATLLKRAGTKLIIGHAMFVDGKTVIVTDRDGEVEIRAKHVVIATGSDPVELPAIPFSDKVISSAAALALDQVPSRLAVVGGGYIGLEIGTAFAKLGAKVSIIEASKRILPQYDAELTRPIADHLKALNVDILTGHLATSMVADELIATGHDGVEREVSADKVLVAIGRKPRSDTANIPTLALSMNGQYILIDDECRTSMSDVFAIGDVTGEPMLAHRAMAQGEMVAEIIAGKRRSWDKRCIPAICFTEPEIVTCGLSVKQAEQQGIEVETGQFPLAANGRAMTMESEDGFIRVIAQAQTGIILGIEAVGECLSELSAAFSIAIEMGARADDLGDIIFAHPTQSEALHEASLQFLGHSLHS